MRLIASKQIGWIKNLSNKTDLVTTLQALMKEKSKWDKVLTEIDKTNQI